jgi:hypothetical protein
MGLRSLQSRPEDHRGGGREKIQVRVELGILQMEVDGRPDGKRPYEMESLLDYYESRLRRHVSGHGTEEGFELDGEACEELRQEGLLYYHRYVLFFELGDYERTVRDTDRNARLFDFVWNYATDKKAPHKNLCTNSGCGSLPRQ